MGFVQGVGDLLEPLGVWVTLGYVAIAWLILAVPLAVYLNTDTRTRLIRKLRRLMCGISKIAGIIRKKKGSFTTRKNWGGHISSRKNRRHHVSIRHRSSGKART